MSIMAGKIAKQLREGVKVVVVCIENAILLKSQAKAIEDFKAMMNKRCATNPRRGPFHPRRPSAQFIKAIKPMLDHKKHMGKIALSRLSVYEGIPREFEGMERVKFNAAITRYSKKVREPTTTLGNLLKEFGWKYSELTAELVKSVRNNEQEKKAELKQKELMATEYKNTSEFESEVKKRLAAYI